MEDPRAIAMQVVFEGETAGNQWPVELIDRAGEERLGPELIPPVGFQDAGIGVNDFYVVVDVGAVKGDGVDEHREQRGG